MLLLSKASATESHRRIGIRVCRNGIAGGVRILPALVLLVGLSGTQVSASEIESRFADALKAYQAAHYAEAAQAFHEIASARDRNTRITSSLYLWARSLLKEQNYDGALNAATQLVQRYAMSSYLDDAHYLRGEAYFKLGEYVSCADELIWIAENSADQRMVARARERLRDLCRFCFSDRERRSVSTHASKASTQRLILGLTEKSLADQGIVIGAILPLTGPESGMGVAARQGLEYALKRWKDTSKLSVFLSVQDSRNSAYVTAQLTRDLLELEQASVILCAGSEGIVTACASQANARQVPCVILNPQTYSLTTLGESVFQLYPDRRTEGEALAAYAVETLGLHSFAVLAAATDDGKELANGFSETVTKLGGEALIQEWYYPGSLDFKMQFSRIREWGWGLTVANDSDSTAVVESQDPQSSQWAYLVNGEILTTKESDSDDSLDVPVTAYDGFFIAPDPGDVNALAPQYVYYNFDAQLLGSRDWDYEDTFDKNRNYLSGIVYSEDVFWDPDHSADRKWADEFRATAGVAPTIEHIRGYDAMTWLLGAVTKSGVSPSELPQLLAQRRRYQGKGGTYKFYERLNVSVSIAKYDKGTRQLISP